MGDRMEQLERTVRSQGRALWVLGSLLALSVLAGTTLRPADTTKVVIEKPVKIILEDIGYRVRSSHPLPVEVKD